METLNIFGERERPNLGFARAAKRAVSAQLSFSEARQIYLLATCVLYIGRTVSRWAGEQNGTYLALSARQSWSIRQLACSSMCTCNPSVRICKLHLGAMKGIYTASVSHRRLQRMPSNGGEFSSWLDRSAHIARHRRCKKKRVQSRACALTRHTNDK